MARKLDREFGRGHSTDAALLRILEWDDGALQPADWCSVSIVYRQERTGFQSNTTRPSLRVVIDPPEAMPKPE